MTNPTLAQVAVGVVEPARSGMASGINNTFRQVGIATGIAGLGAIFQARTESQASTRCRTPACPAKADQFAHLIATQHVQEARRWPATLRARWSRSARSFISALNEILLVGAIVAFAGAVLGLLLVRQRGLRRTEPKQRSRASCRRLPKLCRA